MKKQYEKPAATWVSFQVEEAFMEEGTLVSGTTGSGDRPIFGTNESNTTFTQDPSSYRLS